jgi:hypothetical protein
MVRSWTHAVRYAPLALLLCSATPAFSYDGGGSQEPPRAWGSSLLPGEPDAGPLSLREDGAQFAYTSRFLFRRLFGGSSRAATF